MKVNKAQKKLVLAFLQGVCFFYFIYLILPDWVFAKDSGISTAKGNSKNVIISQNPQPKSFSEWCQQRDSIATEAKRTVEIILRKIRIADCQKAEKKLLSETSLDLSGSKSIPEERIADLTPLSSLVHLEKIDLKNNGIKDLAPLGYLVNLKTLYLEHGTIHNSFYMIRHGEKPLDLKPLQALDKLENLHLYGNVITDLTPLSSLRNLIFLDLTHIGLSGYDREIASQYIGNLDLTPLSKLTNLQELHLGSNNQIDNFSPLASLKQLRLLSINETRAKDIGFLSSLKNLQEFHAYNNQIEDIAPLANLKTLKIIYVPLNKINNIQAFLSLTQLEKLNLGGNKINDINPLEKLVNLEELYLWGNDISNVSSLISLKKLLILDLSWNPKIQDITSLGILNNLQALKLNGNRLLPRNCPLPKPYICIWDNTSIPGIQLPR